jgi:hypothetical protein
MLTPRARPTLKTDANTAKYVAQRMFHAPVDIFIFSTKHCGSEPAREEAIKFNCEVD